ncbi:hypothetical protein [Neisseria sicca]|nr:hypothetical protein [Neisseria sicca]
MTKFDPPVFRRPVPHEPLSPIWHECRVRRPIMILAGKAHVVRYCLVVRI